MNGPSALTTLFRRRTRAEPRWAAVDSFAATLEIDLAPTHVDNPELRIN